MRGSVKKLLRGSIPLLRGRFRFYGHTIHFPPGSHIFERLCDTGSYERETMLLVTGLAEPETTYIDVGANIGLLSIPVLALNPSVKVISIEGSPATLPYLLKTQAGAPRRNDWTVIGAAVGAEPGEMQFWTGGAAKSAFDGLEDTGRGGKKQAVRVKVRTIDDIWQSVGKPRVSVIKMDIEGGELNALRGARECIETTRPIVIIEWSGKNLPAYGIRPEALLGLCDELGYQLHVAATLFQVHDLPMLKMAMALTDTFLLAPPDA